MELAGLEQFIKSDGAVGFEEARSVIQANATDGALLRSAAMGGSLRAVKLFIEAKDRFDLTPEEKEKCTNKGAADGEGTTPLHLAAQKGHTEIVEYLLSTGALINVTNKDDITPLFYAAREGHEDTVKVLLSLGADHSIYSFYSDNYAIDAAIKSGHCQVVQLLLKGGSGSEKSVLIASETGNADMVHLLQEHNVFFDYKAEEEITSPLHVAAEKGYLNVFRVLLEDDNVDVCVKDEQYRMPLHLAAEGGHIEIAKLLLSHSVPVSAVDEKGRTPLHNAAEKGDLEMARLLLSHGAEINAIKYLQQHISSVTRRFFMFDQGEMDAIVHKIHNNLTDPLHHAVLGGCLPMVQLIIEAGAQINGTVLSTITPYDVPVGNGNLCIGLFLQSQGAVLNKSHLLSRAVENGRFLACMCLVVLGADVNDCCDTALLHIAVEKNYFDIVRFLLQKEANVNARDRNGIVPLHYACNLGHESIAKLLIEHSALVNATDKNGNTPLHWKRSLTNCRFLLEKGADPNVVNANGEAALHKNCNIDDIREFLRYNVLVDARDVDGNTPLFNTCRSGLTNATELLIEHGASVNTRNKCGDTPLKLACQNGHFPIARILHENDAVLTYRYQEEETLLHVVCRTADLKSVTFLLEQNLNVNLRDKCGNSPLHEAAERTNFLATVGHDRESECNRQEIAKSLIAKGAVVDVANVFGQTPLYNAVQWAGTEFIKLLLENGADPLYQSNSIVSPLELAQQIRSEDIVSLLQSWVSKGREQIQMQWEN